MGIGARARREGRGVRGPFIGLREREREKKKRAPRSKSARRKRPKTLDAHPVARKSTLAAAFDRSSYRLERAIGYPRSVLGCGSDSVQHRSFVGAPEAIEGEKRKEKSRRARRPARALLRLFLFFSYRRRPSDFATRNLRPRRLLSCLAHSASLDDGHRRASPAGGGNRTKGQGGHSATRRSRVPLPHFADADDG